MEAPGAERRGPRQARSPRRAPVIDARVRPEAVGEPLLVDPEVHRLLRRRHDRHVEHAREVFVNRNLRMDRIEAVGFDMDYTLAVYHLRNLETLSFEMTLEVMIEEKGYPARYRHLRYDPDFVIRGLVVDKHLGNILKMDRHGHVGRVFHGKRRLGKDDRIHHYRTQKIHFGTERYVWVDTLFALPEADLYAQIIDDHEGRGERVDYHQLYDDIRASIDQVHRDGSLKALLREDFPKYIRRDPEIAPALHKLRSSGKRLFLLTNSYWDYTDAVMRYLLDGVLAEYPHWRSYFDLVVVGAQKPGFFSDGRPFLPVDPESGVVSEAGVPNVSRGGVFQGGNLAGLESGSGWSGDRVLYVGDHIYGDILRTKRSGLWRTAMVLQELEDEIRYVERRYRDWQRLDRLEDLRFRLDDELIQQKGLVAHLERHRDGAEAEYLGAKADLDRLRRALRGVLERVEDLAEDLDGGANPYWGLVLKEGGEKSRFGDQVEDYACIYTSRVSNLLFYSPTQYFRSRRGRMPHEETLGRG